MEQKEVQEEECPKSKRVDGKAHTWQFDGDDPYVVCCWCKERRDAITGSVIKERSVVQAEWTKEFDDYYPTIHGSPLPLRLQAIKQFIEAKLLAQSQRIIERLEGEKEVCGCKYKGEEKCSHHDCRTCYGIKNTTLDTAISVVKEII